MSTYQTFARFYDELTQNVEYEKIAGCFDSLILRYGKKGLLVDLGCGTGSLSIALAKLGHEVIGVDSSEMMLSQAFNKMYGAGQSITFLHQNMEELDLYGTIENVVSSLDSLNHVMEDEALLRTFQRVSLFLERGGLFLFDVNTPYKHEKVLGDETFVYDLDNIYCVWNNEYDRVKKQTQISLDFFEAQEDGSYVRTGEQFFERPLDRGQIEALCKGSGLKVIAEFDDYTLGPVHEKTQRAIYVTQKI